VALPGALVQSLLKRRVAFNWETGVGAVVEEAALENLERPVIMQGQQQSNAVHHLITRDMQRELERLKKRWGEAAYQQAWAAGERHYRTLMASLVPLGETIDGHQAGSSKRTEACL
jgi:hypothetical protein